MELNGSCYYLIQGHKQYYQNVCSTLNTSAVEVMTHYDDILNLYYYTYSLQRSPCLVTDIVDFISSPVSIERLFSFAVGIFDPFLQFELYNIDVYKGNLENCSNSAWIYCKKEPNPVPLLNSSDQLGYVIQCPSGEFILEEYKCDKDPDCHQAVDEEGCHPPCLSRNPGEICNGCLLESCLCNSTYFKCFNGGCISFTKLCNNIADC